VAQNDSPDLIAGTIADTAARLALWARRAPSGLARVEFTSEFPRQRVVDRLRADLDAQGIPFHEIALPRRWPAVEVVRELMARLGSLDAGVVSIAGFATAFTVDVPLADSLRILNYNRENLALVPLRQVWWMTRPFAQTFLHAVPDLNSWFMVRLRLTEIIEGESPELIERVGRRSSIEIDEARRRSRSLIDRFRHALGSGSSVHDLIDLAYGAIGVLLDVDAIGEARAVADDVFFPAIERLIPDLNAHGPETLDLARRLDKLAGIYSLRGRASEAEPMYQHAWEIRHRFLGSNHPESVNSLIKMADNFAEQHSWTKAIATYQRSLAIRRECGDRIGEGRTLNDLGIIHSGQGRWDEAIDAYEHSLAIHREVGDRSGEASALNNLAGVYADQGRWDEAADTFQQSLVIYREFGDRIGKAVTFRNLGKVYANRGRWDEAIDAHEQSLAVQREIGDPRGEGLTLMELAHLWADQKDFARALELGRQALPLLDTTRDEIAHVFLQNSVQLWERRITTSGD